MSKLADRIEKQIQKLRRGDVTNDTVNNFMNYLRQFAEENGMNVPRLRLYADWCVHPRLHRKGAQDVLMELENAFRKEIRETPGTFTGATMVNSLSLAGLRADIRLLLEHAGLDTNIVTNPAAFFQLRGVLLEELAHKPLMLTDAKVNARIGGQEPSEQTVDYMVTSLAIVPNENREIPAQFQVAIKVRPIPPHPFVPEVTIQSPI
jgi:hypothetical protein